MRGKIDDLGWEGEREGREREDKGTDDENAPVRLFAKEGSELGTIQVL